MNIQDDIPYQYNKVQFSAGDCSNAINAELAKWQKENKVERLWAGDPTLWTDEEENKWMGWLNVAAENKYVPRITALANEIKSSGITNIVLLGMGGSSLFPAMMAKIFGQIPTYPRLHVLDSTDPLHILHLEERIDLNKTFFVVSSKSGTTLETNMLREYFFTRLQTVLNTKDVGNRFIAITDQNTSLATIARKNHFKDVFYGIPSIGGRYSALSNFGMVPSGLMGIDVGKFLSHVEPMRKACSPAVLVKDNPGVVLGVILGVCAKMGKDKVTLITSSDIDFLGSWIQQLLAESTGKQGKGLIPVDQEPICTPSVYGEDRVFIYIRSQSAADPAQDRGVFELEQKGFVVVQLLVFDKMHLGAELFRWEIATDVASSIIGINPFNQPDVEESKVLSLKLTDQYEKEGQFAQPKPFFSAEGISLYTDEKNEQEIIKHLVGKPSIASYLRAHLDRTMPGDYVDLSAFIEMSDAHIACLQESRLLIRNSKKVATCLGFGPRFLHSTGQDYKGGSNTGVFLQITSDYSKDIEVPGHRYTFGLFMAAQAQADLAILAQRARRILRIHLGKDTVHGLRRLRDVIRSIV